MKEMQAIEALKSEKSEKEVRTWLLYLCSHTDHGDFFFL